MSRLKILQNRNAIAFQFIIPAFTLFFLLIHTGAFAHRVTVFAWVKGDMVYTESKFSGGKKAQNAVVEVFDARGHKLLAGKTDENGAFSFKAPQKGELKIVLIAGMGHRGEWTVSADEFENIMAVDSEPVQKLPATENAVKAELTPEKKYVMETGLTPEDIQAIVEKALDKKLAPVLTKLNKPEDPRHGPGFSEIFGGIGYILGLMGLATYVNFRKKK